MVAFLGIIGSISAIVQFIPVESILHIFSLQQFANSSCSEGSSTTPGWKGACFLLIRTLFKILKLHLRPFMPSTAEAAILHRKVWSVLTLPLLFRMSKCSFSKHQFSDSCLIGLVHNGIDCSCTNHYEQWTKLCDFYDACYILHKDNQMWMW